MGQNLPKSISMICSMPASVNRTGTSLEQAASFQLAASLMLVGLSLFFKLSAPSVFLASRLRATMAASAPRPQSAAGALELELSQACVMKTKTHKSKSS